ncbi:MAG: peptidoglycan DD-metalloendopeptidase family protein [Candidatus Krumholzibacteriota bacterium]|nr:peptidoglycan DD-metalloendopeptidase family protein [Candidatus Krumholzibacteriota bacterium]
MSTHVDSLDVAISAHELTLTERRGQLGRRLRQLYMRDPRYRWEILLGSRTIDQAVTRYKFLKLIAERDAALVSDFRDRQQGLVLETARLTESLADMAMVRQDRETETGQLETNKDQREAVLKSIRTQKSQHARAIKDLEKAQEQVKDLLGALEKRRLAREDQGYVGDGDFASLKGTMKWPVKGKVIRGFGKIRHPKYGTVTFNNGIDIRAAGGTPIVAVAAGSVEFVDWIDAYGKCIILNHGGGYYTLYSHVSTTFVAQGQTVADAEVIAEVGDTGSLDGYVCHFEIRQSKKALDPMKWLSKSKKTGAS